jgi:hypothetical protein
MRMIERESYYMAPEEDLVSKCDIMTENPPARSGTSGIRIIIPVVNCEHACPNIKLLPAHWPSCSATKIPFIYSFSGNCAASVPISTFMCLCLIDLYIHRVGPHIACRRIGRSIVGTYKSLMQTHECGNWYCGRAIHILGIFVSNFVIGSLQYGSFTAAEPGVGHKFC